jgi:hypothetical protein
MFGSLGKHHSEGQHVVTKAAMCHASAVDAGSRHSLASVRTNRIQYRLGGAMQQELRLQTAEKIDQEFSAPQLIFV